MSKLILLILAVVLTSVLALPAQEMSYKFKAMPKKKDYSQDVEKQQLIESLPSMMDTAEAAFFSEEGEEEEFRFNGKYICTT